MDKKQMLLDMDMIEKMRSDMAARPYSRVQQTAVSLNANCGWCYLWVN